MLYEAMASVKYRTNVTRLGVSPVTWILSFALSVRLVRELPRLDGAYLCAVTLAKHNM